MQGPPAYANGGFAPPPPGMQVVQQVVQPPPGHGPPPGLHIVQQMPPPPHHQQHNEPHHFQGQPPPGAVVTQVVHGPPPPPPPGFQNVPPPDFQKPHGHHQGPPPANGPPPRGSAPYPPASRQRGDPNYEPLDLPPPGWVPPTRQDNHQQGQGRAAEEPVRTGSVPPPGYEEQQPGGAEVSVASEDKVQQQSIDASDPNDAQLPGPEKPRSSLWALNAANNSKANNQGPAPSSAEVMVPAIAPSLTGGVMKRSKSVGFAKEPELVGVAAGPPSPPDRPPPRPILPAQSQGGPPPPPPGAQRSLVPNSSPQQQQHQHQQHQHQQHQQQQQGPQRQPPHPQWQGQGQGQPRAGPLPAQPPRRQGGPGPGPGGIPGAGGGHGGPQTGSGVPNGPAGRPGNRAPPPSKGPRMLVATRGVLYEAQALMIGLAAKGIAFDVVDVPELDDEKCPQWFKNASPIGEVPVLLALPPNGIPVALCPTSPTDTDAALAALDALPSAVTSSLCPSETEHFIKGAVAVAKNMVSSFEQLVSACSEGVVQEPLDGLWANMTRLESLITEQRAQKEIKHQLARNAGASPGGDDHAGSPATAGYFLGDGSVICLADLWLAPMAARLKLLHFMVKTDMTSSFRLTSQYFAAADKFKEYALSAYPVERVQAFYFDDVLGRSAGPSKRRVSGDTSVVSTITSSLQQTMQYILDDLRQSVDACSKREADATPNFKELLRIKGVWSSYRVLVEAHWGLHIRLGSLSDQVQAIGPPNLTQATELFEDVFFTTGSDQLSRLVSLQSELSRISTDQMQTATMLNVSVSLLNKSFGSDLERLTETLEIAIKGWSGGVAYVAVPAILDSLPPWQAIPFAKIVFGMEESLRTEIIVAIKDGIERGVLRQKCVDELAIGVINLKQSLAGSPSK